MHTFTRPGSRVRIHVNSDWSGDAIVGVEHTNMVGDKTHSAIEIPVFKLLNGDVVGYLSHDFSPTFLCEAVSIAVEAYMARKAEWPIGSLTLPPYPKKTPV